MNEAPLVALNLLLNGVGSFAVGALVTLAASRGLRAAPGRAGVWLFALPFAKVVLDAARGIPEDSFLWLRARGLSQELGSFQLGMGLERIVPKIDLTLGALRHGVTYSQSAADLVSSGLIQYVSGWAPGAVALALLAGSVAHVARRGGAMVHTRAERQRATAQAPIAVRTAGRRRVPVHVVPGLEGSPYTGGVLRPFIAFPERLWGALSPAEREAAILHELSHVAELHVLLVLASGLVRDVFWFVPFIGRFHARLVLACEIAADVLATERGADPLALASALVRTQEIARGGASTAFAPSSVVLGAASGMLTDRVERLLRPAPRPTRFARGRIVARALFVGWIASIVFIAIPLGNH